MCKVKWQLLIGTCSKDTQILLRSIMKVATLTNRFSMLTEQLYIGRRCHLGLSRLERRSQGPASEDRVTLLLGANAAGVSWSWSQCSFTALKILRPLRIMLHLLCLCFINGATKPDIAHLFTTLFTRYFKPTVDTYCPERFLSNITAQDHTPVMCCPWALMETYNEMKVVFRDRTLWILTSVNQGKWAFLNYKKFYFGIIAQ